MERYKKEFKETFKPNFKNVWDFCKYLQHTLIPDLEKSRNFKTANDFKEACYWIETIYNRK